jgi:hypothetical protein
MSFPSFEKYADGCTDRGACSPDTVKNGAAVDPPLLEERVSDIEAMKVSAIVPKGANVGSKLI